MGELLDYVTQLDPKELDFEVVVPQDVVGRAYGLCYVVYDVQRKHHSLESYEHNIHVPDRMRHLDSEEREHAVSVIRWYVTRHDQYLEEARSFVYEQLRRFGWLRYCAFLPYFTYHCVLALLSRPPQKVYQRKMRVDVWWNYFIPIRFEKVEKGKKRKKKHNPIPTQVFYGYFTFFLRVYYPKVNKKLLSEKKIREMLEMCQGADRLIEEFDSKVKQYSKQYGKKTRAVANAFHDIVRIFLGNIYLVWTYVAVQCGILESKKLQLPEELVRAPLRARDYINPEDTVYRGKVSLCSQYVGVDIRQVTWTWLVKSVIELDM